MNDAFGTAHRAGHHLRHRAIRARSPAPARCWPPRSTRHLQALAKKRPLLAIVAGSKVSTKLSILQSLAKNVDGLIVGGGIANTFLLAEGLPIGTSKPGRAGLVDEAKAVIAAMKARGAAVPIPWTWSRPAFKADAAPR